MKVKIIRKSFILLSVLSVIAICTAVGGCSAVSSNEEKTPESVIRDAYGNEQFKITFNAANLAEPISDIYYTALNIPNLPTPVKVGYVFEGWYFDSDYTKPYEDGSLYMYMSDVTLYAKWTREEFTQNGIYQIEYSLEILEDTVSKSALCDEYGGYKNFADALVEGEVYFEKSEKGTLLRLQYDCGYLASDVYTVTLSSRNGSKFVLAASETVDSVTDTLKTIYINWGDNEIDSTLYLDVRTINYETEELTSTQRAQTAASYTMAFNVTEFLGYSRSFVDTSNTLDDGYYLVRTYFRSESNGTSTMDIYNPVYSYLIAEDGNYTLVKPFYPYAGLVGAGVDTDYYYNRFMTFAPMRLCYDIAPVGDNTVSSDYLPAVNDGGYYCGVSVEFHADTGKYYHIFEIGSNINRDFVVVNTVTGMMELMTHYGTNNIIMTIDREHIIKLTEIDYEPLVGDAYEFNGKEFTYYAGSNSDFSYSDSVYDIMLKYGFGNRNVNFYWSAANINADYADRTIYSSRITIAPTGVTNEKTVAQSRYQFATFTSNTQIFGYDGSESLYADCYTTKTIINNGLRETVQVVNGRSCTVGEELSVGGLYAQYVNSEADFSEVEFQAYAMNGYSIDFSSPVPLDESFTFSSSLAIVFTRTEEDGNKISVLELAKYTEPSVEFQPNGEELYDPSDTVKNSGAYVKLANVVYSWMGNSGMFINTYYEEDKIVIHPINVAQFCYVDGDWAIGYGAGFDSEGGFYMPSYDTLFVYELTNRYGEQYYFNVYFTVTGDNLYTLTKDGETVLSDRYTEKETGVYKRFSIYRSDATAVYPDTLDDLFGEEYVVANATGEHKMLLTKASLRSYNVNLTLSLTDYDDYGEFIENLKTTIISLPYAYATVYYYTDEGDMYARWLLYNVYFNGKSEFLPMPYETYFTDTTYNLSYLELCDENGVVFGTGNYILYSYSGGTQSSVGSLAVTGNENGAYQIKFNASGKYLLVYSVSLQYDENGRNLFGIFSSTTTSKINLQFFQTIEVVDKNSTVTIHYASTEAHPFIADVSEDGFYTVSYNLADDKIVVPSGSVFEETSSTFIGWGVRTDYTARDSSVIIMADSAIADYITRFNAKEITLYPIWDDKITITVFTNIDIDGFEPLTHTYSMSVSGGFRGFYEVNLYASFGSALNKYATGVYNFVGFTGGFIGDTIFSYQNLTSYIIEGQSEDYYTVTAIFTRTYNVKYDITATTEDGTRYSTTYFGYTQVSSGQVIGEPSREVVCKVDGYEFKYWAIKSDNGELVYFDVADTPITDDMADDDGYITLYAVFGLIGE